MQSLIPQDEEPHRITVPSQNFPVFTNTFISVHESGYNWRSTVHANSTVLAMKNKT